MSNNTFYKLKLSASITLFIKEEYNNTTEKFTYKVGNENVTFFNLSGYTATCTFIEAIQQEILFSIESSNNKKSDSLYKILKALIKLTKKHDIKYEVLCSLDNENKGFIEEIEEEGFKKGYYGF